MRLSSTMHAVLRDLSTRGGSRTFISGWPTYTALQDRGLVTIRPDPESKISWIVKLTEEGWALYPTAVPT